MNTYNNQYTNQYEDNAQTDAFTVIVGGDSLEPGTYQVRLKDIEAYNENVERYGPGWRWVFVVVSGPETGRTTSRITSRIIAPKSNAWSLFVKPILKRPLAPGERFDVRSLIGAEGQGVVEEVEGGSRLVFFAPSSNGASNGAANGQTTQVPHI